MQAALRSWCAPYAEREGRGSEDHDSVAFCEVQLQLLTGRTHQLRAQVGRGTAVYVRGRERHIDWKLMVVTVVTVVTVLAAGNAGSSHWEWECDCGRSGVCAALTCQVAAAAA